MMKTLTAKMFSDHLEQDGDFRKMGSYVVTELILLPNRKITHEVNLGTGVFKELFYVIYSHFTENFDCGKSTFESRIVFKQVICEKNLIFENKIVN